jgi:putative hydrolase of the HAD superfamily
VNPLVELFRACSQPLFPMPTGVSPVLPRLVGIKAVLFDVYGTLLVSGSGDISLARAEDRGPAIALALKSAGYAVPKPEAPFGKLLLETIEAFRASLKEKGTPYPEVRIEAVWREFIAIATSREWVGAAGQLESAIIDYECRVNPCWPMPGATAVLQALREHGLCLGIISNAQFYTPLLMEALLGRPPSGLGFDPELCIWSYELLEGKPSHRLYSIAAQHLANQGIQPSAVLFVGNDMRNDIWPAQVTGFKTALFAGDKRSLRWREDHPQAGQTSPDAIVTTLSDLSDLIGLS